MKDRRRPAFETSARELHKKAEIPLGPCTFAEVARFGEVLDIQIVVISTQERNGAKTDQSSEEHVVNFAVAQYSDSREMVFREYLARKEICINIMDSMSFLPMPLSKLPNCFGLSELKKEYFPHLFNVRENQNYVGPLPSQQFYCADSMFPSARAVFMSWHADHENDQFDFQKEMMEYCRSDVEILRRCCLIFREEFLKIADVDPFRNITIASACTATFKTTLLSWSPFTGRSSALTQSGGWIKSPFQKALPFNMPSTIVGCFFHGCDKCYDSDATHPLKGTTMSSVTQKAHEICERFRSFGFKVVEMWEHQFAEMKKQDPELRLFLSSHELQDRLKSRDLFFGGRTNAIKLFHQVNKYCIYPVGHPQIITEGFKEIEEYFGIVRCKVIPPRGLYLPVSPYRSQNKLMFPLCRSCVESNQQTPCIHNDEERGLTEVAAIHWHSKKEYLSQDASTNIFIATFTTAWARLKLYNEMYKLGRSVLYHDTDSIIYASDGMKILP
ncbi:hypothetical protein AVEN_64698-1 [Araneus ventricosus]|uniref:DNA-directed DNA polymerase n=1 Tax=Araneus ventricosus TaxID=182803 RepID=A0A4Y2Q7I4_ARAVE|nr:hypothetical protein AVEN_64698-1 [Araneus ventricosus]